LLLLCPRNSPDGHFFGSYTRYLYLNQRAQADLVSGTILIIGYSFFAASNSLRVKYSLSKEIIMPKVKTNRCAAKRFRSTGSGKIRRRKAYHSHILTKKSPKRKMNLRKDAPLDSSNVKQVKRLLPNGI
jgi:large subunit ribosomal protein L35